MKHNSIHAACILEKYSKTCPTFKSSSWDIGITLPVCVLKVCMGRCVRYCQCWWGTSGWDAPAGDPGATRWLQYVQSDDLGAGVQIAMLSLRSLPIRQRAEWCVPEQKLPAGIKQRWMARWHHAGKEDRSELLLKIQLLPVFWIDKSANMTVEMYFFLSK